MISMRYAHNLAGGYGLVWNPDERVEGSSNPLLPGDNTMSLAPSIILQEHCLPKPVSLGTWRTIFACDGSIDSAQD